MTTNGLGFLFGGIKMVWNLIVVMVAQLCEHAKTTKFFTVIEGYLVWYVKYISIK